MSIYRVAITTPASYTAITAPNLVLPFRPKSILFLNEDTTPANKITISDDGVTTKAVLTPGLPSAGIRLGQKGLNWWVKGVGSAVLQVIAEY